MILLRLLHIYTLCILNTSLSLSLSLSLSFSLDFPTRVSLFSPALVKERLRERAITYSLKLLLKHLA
jgi:hypothetical protein